MKYEAEANDALEAVRDAGGPVKLRRLGVTPPTDPDAPWEGNDTPGADVDHVACFVPFSSINGQADPFTDTALIPAAGLTFEVVTGLVIIRADGTHVVVGNVQTLRPDGVTPILYTCEVSAWRAT